MKTQEGLPFAVWQPCIRQQTYAVMSKIGGTYEKTAIFLLSVIILLSVSGCGNTERNIPSEKTEKQPEQSAENMAESLETDYADNHGNHESPGLKLSELSIKISSDEKEAGRGR